MRLRRTAVKGRLSPIRLVATALLIFGLAIAIAGSFYDHNTLREAIEQFYSNSGVELISIAITVLVIDALYERRTTREEKEALIYQLTSPSKVLVVEALRVLRRKGWLSDGSLHKANLMHADFQGLDLSGASLKQADFRYASLERANMSDCDMHRTRLSWANLNHAILCNTNLTKCFMRHGALDHANLTEANLTGSSAMDRQLAKAYGLQGSYMPDGGFYNGRFNLEEIKRNYERGLFSLSDLLNSRAMAEYYDVSVDQYEEGQTWARENTEWLRETQGEIFLGDWLAELSDDG